MFNNNWKAFYATVADLIESDGVKSMDQYPHHLCVTCYEHSVFVAYVAFRIARKLGCDERTAARGALLHDFYLYDSADKTQYEGNQLFAHPVRALENAKKHFSLSKKEENIIISHMWPLSKKMPKSTEAFIVSLADKYCAVLEAMHIWHKMKMCTRTRAAIAYQSASRF